MEKGANKRYAGMTDSELANRETRIRFPQWAWGGDVRGYADACHWRAIPENETEGWWRVRLDERARRRPPGHISVAHMARVTNRHSIGAYSALKKLLPQDKLIDPESIRRVNAEIERLEAEGASAIAAVLSGLNMATMVCRQADLAGHVQNTLRCLEESDFPLAASHLVLVDAALGFRTRTPSVLLQSEDDPTPPASGDMVFKAALGLLGDVNFGMAAYLSPLLLSLSPYVWGFTSPRAGGVLLYTFGRRTAGHGGLATEPLQLFTPLGRETAFPVPDTTPRASSRAVEWWSR